MPAHDAVVLVQGSEEVMNYYGYKPVKYVDELESPNAYISINNMDVNEYQALLEDVRSSKPEDKELVVLLAKRSIFDACHLYKLDEDDYKWPVVINRQYNGVKVVRFSDMN